VPPQKRGATGGIEIHEKYHGFFHGFHLFCIISYYFSIFQDVNILQAQFDSTTMEMNHGSI
jgi:hypothetical protein